MGLGRRNARQHETVGFQKNALDSSAFWEYKPQQQVMTVDGVPGVVTAVLDGPYPGTEEYEVTLDNGLGGGSYTASQLQPLAGTTASHDHEATGLHTADQDYPELGSILHDRPPIERMTFSAARGDNPFEIQHEEINTGGTKFPRRVDMTAHHPETGEEAGRARYYPPKRRGGPISIDEVKGHAPGAASALLNEIESRHPGSSTKFLHEVKRNNNNPDVTGHAHEHAGQPTDWDTHYPNLAPTIHRGLSLRLPSYSARTVNSSGSTKDEHLAEIHAAMPTGPNVGTHWTENEHAAQLFANNAVSDHRTDIPVVLHASTPAKKDLETRRDHLYRGGVFPYGDPHSSENEIPVRRGRDVAVTGISWRPDAAHPDADENGWLHHTYDEPMHHTAAIEDAEDEGTQEAEPEIPPCAYCGSDQMQIAGDNGRAQQAKCQVCGGMMSAPYGLQFKPELIGDPSNHPKDDPDPASGGVPGAANMRVPVKRMNDSDYTASLHEAASVADDPGRWEYRQREWDNGNMTFNPISHSKDLGRFALHAEHPDENGDRMIHAVTPEGRYIGHTFFGDHPHHEGYLEGAPEVHPDYRRQGVGTAMYDYAEELGGKPMAPSMSHSDEAAAFWRNRVHGSLHTASDDEQDVSYRMQHQAPDADYGAPLHDVENMMPGFYEHPEWHDHGEEDFHTSANVIHGARGKPEQPVKVYRALPAEHAGKGFNTGDWVSTSKSYARQHAMVHPDSKHDWPVISTTVPAKHLHTAGDVHEWAYNGPGSPATGVAFKGGYHQEVRQRADGSIAPVQRKKTGAQHEAGERDWCTFRHNARCFYPGPLNAEGIRLSTPQDRGPCAWDYWQQQVCPISEPGPMALMQAKGSKIDELQDPDFKFHFTASWSDVRAKARRIRSEGQVNITVATNEGVGGEVKGDHHVYETVLTYVPGTYKVGSWECGCKWAAYAWGRSPAYRRFEGRMCSHALAMQFEAQAQGMFGRAVEPSTERPKWLRHHTPVVTQFERDSGENLTRRAVPPGNMRRTYEGVAGEQPYYHGTTMPDMESVLPSSQHGDNPLYKHMADPNYAYATTDPSDAWNYAKTRYNNTEHGIPRVYQVTPMHGDHTHVEHDPNFDDGTAFRSPRGWHVDHEVSMPEHMKGKWPEEREPSPWSVVASLDVESVYSDDHGLDLVHPPVYAYVISELQDPVDAMNFMAALGMSHSAARAVMKDVSAERATGKLHFEASLQLLAEEGERQESEKKRCPDCGSMISVNDEKCPHCHHVFSQHEHHHGAKTPGEGDLMSRGMVIGGEWDKDAVHRVMNGNATAHDLLHHIDKSDVGDFWYPHEPHLSHESNISGAKDFAQTETSDHPAEDLDRQHPIGEVGVVLVGHKPHGWDPENNPDHGLMGNSYIPHSADVPLHQIHYHDHNGDWHSADAAGHTVHVTGGGYDEPASHAGSLAWNTSGTSLPVSNSPAYQASASASVDDHGLGSVLMSLAARDLPGVDGGRRHARVDVGGETPSFEVIQPYAQAVKTSLTPDGTAQGVSVVAGVVDDELGWDFPDQQLPHQAMQVEVLPVHNRTAVAVATSGSGPHVAAVTRYEDDLAKEAVGKQEVPTVAGVLLKAADTGRILMLQRGLHDESDPAKGTWESPGGHIEPGDQTSLHAAIREFEEETGHPFPEGGVVHHTWTSPNGVYQGHLVLIPEESAVQFQHGRQVVNPDNPDGDQHEQAAWWDPDHARKNPALREELKTGTPWKEIKAAGNTKTAATADPLYGLEEASPMSPPQHSRSQNPASTGWATAQDPHSWDDPEENATNFGALPADGYLGNLHDKPEPALPSTDGAESELDNERDDADPSQYDENDAELTPNTTLASVGSTQDIVARFQATAAASALGGGKDGGSHHAAQQANNKEIARAAQEFLTKRALKDFNFAEQQELINEGARDKTMARNSDVLDIEGTHYNALEAALAAEEALEDSAELFV